MIDLHIHTNESDGSLSPAELIQLATDAGLEALAITDHDTFAGYDQAMAGAIDLGLDLICGIELSTKAGHQTVHLLGYFLNGGPTAEFRTWILELQDSRQKRNRDLLRKLQKFGFDITMEEAKARGKNQVGRPQIAELMLAKGYVKSVQHAFDNYLGETGVCYTPREEPQFLEAVDRIRLAGGMSSLAHPGRISPDPRLITTMVHDMRRMGLCALEVYHSEHSRDQVSLFKSLAKNLSLAVTGGSDFHGSSKPRINIRTGMDGNLSIAMSVLHDLRSRAQLAEAIT